MKKFSKILSVMLLVALVLSLGASAFAAELPEGTQGADKTITIITPTGVASDARNTYTVYKVFDADPNDSAISYKSLDGSAPAGFTVDDAGNVYLGELKDTATGNPGEFAIVVGGATKYLTPTTNTELTPEQVTAIKNYDRKVEVGTVTITGEGSKTVEVPDFGYYFVSTTTGTVVSINSTNKSATVRDKNEVPTLNKTITNTDNTAAGMAGNIDATGKLALAELGKEVEYTATITIAEGEKNYSFHDKMGTGLTFKGNDYVTVTAEPAVSIDKWYTIQGTPDDNDTLTITFKDGIPKDTVITVKYIGIVNSDALTIDTGKNTARVDYGDSNSNNHTPDSTTNVYNGKVIVKKVDGTGAALDGAGFKLKNEAGKYYKYTPDDDTTADVNEAMVTWVDEADATEIYPLKNGGSEATASFTGLVNGTYTLIETTVPSGYNKAADTTVTIANNDFDTVQLSVTTTVTNNSGSVLPSTGGIGTTIFYTVGGILVLAAIVLLVTKKRMSE